MTKYLIRILTIGFFFLSAVQAQSSFGDTLFSFNAGQLTPSPDRALVGVEFAGGHFWVTGFNPPLYDHRLYKISADGGTLVSYTSLGSGYHAYFDLAYDGEFLYATDRDRIVQIDPDDGQLTGLEIPISFGYLLVQGLAYDPASDHFWVIPQRNAQLQIIHEIDRAGNILNTYPNLHTDYTTSLAWDHWSPDGPYLWTFSREEIGYDSRTVMRQFSPAIGAFTGIEIEAVNRSPVILDGPLGIAMSAELDTSTVSMIALQSGALQVTDGLDWMVVYDADLRGQPAPGAQISVSPTSIQYQITQGDSLDIPVFIGNLGQAGLDWDAYVENADTAAVAGGEVGDTLFNFDLVEVAADSNLRARSVAYARGHYWVLGDLFPDQKRLYKIDPDGNLAASYAAPSAGSFGWRSITADDDFIYATDTYWIAVWSIDSTRIVDNIFTGSIPSGAIAFDPNNRHFYLSSSIGAIEVLDRQGEQVRFLVTPYEIEGLAWDQYSPGGPYLWAWVVAEDSSGSRCEALRLDPESGVFTGVRFRGQNYGSYQNFPESATIRADFANQKLVFAGLQRDDVYPGNEAFLAGYDLDVILPPAWLQLVNATSGSVAPQGEDTLKVRFHAMMADTTTAAVIKIGSNDLSQPLLEIPVTIAMLAPQTAIGSDETAVPAQFSLEQNYPNPFNPATVISYQLSVVSDVQLAVYNLLGEKIITLADGRQPAGRYRAQWDGRDRSGRRVSSGVYLYRLSAGDNVLMRKMILLK